MIKKIILLFVLFMSVAGFMLADQIYLEVICEGPWTLSFGPVMADQPDLTLNGVHSNIIGPLSPVDRYKGNLIAILRRRSGDIVDNKPIVISILYYNDSGLYIISASTYSNICSVGFNFAPGQEPPAPDKNTHDENNKQIVEQ